ALSQRLPPRQERLARAAHRAVVDRSELLALLLRDRLPVALHVPGDDDLLRHRLPVRGELFLARGTLVRRVGPRSCHLDVALPLALRLVAAAREELTVVEVLVVVELAPRDCARPDRTGRHRLPGGEVPAKIVLLLARQRPSLVRRERHEAGGRQ